MSLAGNAADFAGLVDEVDRTVFFAHCVVSEDGGAKERCSVAGTQKGSESSFQIIMEAI